MNQPETIGTADPKRYIDKRIGATIIDYILIFFVIGIYIYQFGEPDGQGSYVVTGSETLIPLGFWLVYLVFTEHFLKATLGHKLMKLKVISVNGEQPTFWQTLVRRAVDCLEIFWCFGLIAFLVAKNNQRGQRLGDQWAGTLVVGKDYDPTSRQFDFEKH